MTDAGWHKNPATSKIDWWDGEKWGNPPPTATPKKNQHAVNSFGLGIFGLFFYFLPLVGPYFFSPITALIGFAYGIAAIVTARKYENRGLSLGAIGLLLCVLTLALVAGTVF